MYLYGDNRKYDYTSFENDVRVEYDYILELIKPNTTVIDLGCGNGSLLKRLIDEKKVTAIGVDSSKSAFEACRKKGLKAELTEIDKPLPFADNSFDYSICNVTIQMVMYPEILLQEMKRISKYQVISFPNFAFYRNRIELLFKGRMPKYMLYFHTWYNTGHIHQLSLKDFYELVNFIGGLEILERRFIKNKSLFKDFLIKSFPNLFAQLLIFLLAKTE